MGIIERQSIKGSLVNYTGVIIGFFATLFIYPLDWELYGTIQYWLSSAIILTPILRQGSTALINKFYPYFKKNNIKGVLGLVLIISTLTIVAMSLLLLVFIFVFKEFSFIQQFNIQSQSVVYIYLLAVVMIYFTIFQLHAANIRRIVVPEIITRIGFKLFLILLVVSSYFGVLDSEWTGVLLILFYLLAIIAMYFYLIILGGLDISGWSWKRLPRSVKKQFFSFWIFGGLNYLGILLAYKIDIFMIGTLVDKVSVGYYSTFLFMINLMIIPMSSINQISRPIVSESFENEDISQIALIYKKSSNSLMAVGTIIFLFIWLNIYFVLDFMRNGDDLLPFVYSALFLGLSKIFDLMTSINNVIIVYSKYYRYNLLFLFLLAIVNIALNLWLIEDYGITGAAIATSASLFILNGIKTIFIYKVLGIHPFSKKSLYISITLTVGLVLVSFFQSLVIVNGLTSAIIYSLLLGSICFPLFYRMKFSEELNNMLDKLLRRLK
ncbi:MAG: lipopolysaccharide biosynthesis protein [Bacteroidota bacterium]